MNSELVRLGLKLDAQRNGQLTPEELGKLGTPRLEELEKSVSSYLQSIKEELALRTD